MNSDLRKRMERVESMMANDGANDWSMGIMIGGTANFSYAENVKTGQLSFDPAFLHELNERSKAECRAGRYEEIIVHIGGDDPIADANADRIIQEAIAAGVIDGEQKRSTLRISQENEDESESISGTGGED